ncbi:MAG: thioredoxin family protein [Clostridium sp.]|nr:thioredoxin family protein [Clostridium sp.]
MEKKENKKGFWASLFSPKPCSCSCGDSLIVEEENAGTSCGCVGEIQEDIQAASCCCGTATSKVKEVKVLGPGCSKCKATYSVVERVIKANHLDVKLTKVDDIGEMMSYNIMTTPAVVVDGVVRLKGHVPTEAEVKTLLGI